MANKPVYLKKSKKMLKSKKYNKLGQKSSKYRDAHSFKLQSNQNLLTASTTGRPAVVGSAINMGTATLMPYGNNLWEFTGSINYSLSQCAQQSQLCGLFDRYKINGVKIRIIPEQNFAAYQGGGNIPTIKIINDFDDASTGTATLAVWARRGKEFKLDKPVTIYVKPKIAGYAYQGGVTGAYTVLKCPYINCTYPSVPLYGTKFAVKDWYAPAGQNLNMRFEFTYYVTFKEQLNLGLADLQLPPVEGVTIVDEKEGEPVPCQEQPAQELVI